MKKMIVAFPHKAPNHGGPGSFQLRLESVFKQKGWEVGYSDTDISPDVVIIVGGTSKLGWLFKQRLKGVPVIFRLDGINWLHRKTKVSLKKWILNEVRNLSSQIKRSFFATHIIYQSRFVYKWWENKGWHTNASYSIIQNGVNLESFKPVQSKNGTRYLLAVEGNLDYSPYAIDLLNQLQERIMEKSPFKSLVLYGSFQLAENQKRLHEKIDYRGKVSRSELPKIYRDAVYLSLDVNAACPNTVIEALASGLPVIGFDTGALKELVPNSAGEIVNYGSDPWMLDFPNVDNLYKAALQVDRNWDQYAHEARRYAMDHFNIDDITDRYIEVIEQLTQ